MHLAYLSSTPSASPAATFGLFYQTPLQGNWEVGESEINSEIIVVPLPAAAPAPCPGSSVSPASAWRTSARWRACCLAGPTCVVLWAVDCARAGFARWHARPGELRGCIISQRSGCWHQAKKSSFAMLRLLGLRNHKDAVDNPIWHMLVLLQV